MERTYSQADAGSTVHITRDEPLRISLPENPTTGYRWEVSWDPALLRVAQDDFAVQGIRPGAGGIRTLVLIATCAGTCRVRLDQRRNWDGDTAAQFFLTVVIK
jgi:inhibitor of cysteine peptidase